MFEIIKHDQEKRKELGKITAIIEHLESNDTNRFVAEGHIDYINASWLLNKTAIATQAPLNRTEEFSKFWKMAHLSGSSQIVMVTNLQEGCNEKASKYWSDLQKKVEFQGVEVTCTADEKIYQDGQEKHLPFIVRRQFDVVYQGSTRKIQQYHLVNWFDHGVVSSTSLCKLISSIKAPTSEDPVIAHCSAGIGRTGVFLATAHLFFNHLVKQQPIQKNELHKTVGLMRQRPDGRIHMVGNQNQYALIWNCLQHLAFNRT